MGGFALRGRLGAGGMGQVFLGRSPGGRAVAVKVVHPHLARQPEFRRRFRREVAAARAVSGAFTAPVVAAGPDDDPPWLATVHVPGPDLAEAVRETGPLPEDAVWSLAAGLAEALQAVHAAGLLHRDLKPSNVLMAADGPRVIDFGIARTLEGTVLTHTGQVIGSPGYMSPEQIEGGHVGPAGDVFSLGAVIAYAAGAVEPFGEGAPLAVMHRVVNGRARLDHLHGPLRELAGSCLAKNPAERPALPAILDRITAHWQPADDVPGGSPWPAAVTALIHDRDIPPTAAYTMPAGSATTHSAPTVTSPPEGARGGDGQRHAERTRSSPPGTSGKGTPRRPVIGIDFGMTTCAMSVFEGRRVRPIPNAEGATTTPSVVSVLDDGSVLVGTAAERQAVLHPDHTVRAVGSKLGTEWSVTRGPTRLAAEDAVRLLLARLRKDAEAHLGGQLGGTVLTVPVAFGLGRRTALYRAGEEAGLRVLRIINAPSATAMAYGMSRDDDSTVLILDLGGGTLDVAVVAVDDGVVEVRGTAGTARLGGDDWDLRIVQQLTDRVRRQYGVDLTNDAVTTQRLRQAAEAAKRELSTARSASVRLPFLGSGPLLLDEVLTRDQFEACTRDLLERCRTAMEQALEDAGHTFEDIDRVLLAGGASRMPAVGALVRRLACGREPHRGLAPESVVTGAALQAGVLTGAVKDVLLLDVHPVSLGVETLGGVMSKVFQRNTTIPTKVSAEFTTHSDNQRAMVVHVVEGERAEVARNRTVAVLELNLPPAPAGVPRVEVTADVDAAGIFHVTAKDLGSGNSAASTVNRATVDSAVGLVRSPRWAGLRGLVPRPVPAATD
ncbi:Hsp70 family protein [Streptomyces sp. RFCAC02]|uniref:Hsp70 family protein n=1 Tax=Streptomyces sp. RFCAC02 TaxID=2499143 RepID=UPI003209DFBF